MEGNRSTGMRTRLVTPMTISARQMTTMKYGLRIEKPDIYSTIRSVLYGFFRPIPDCSRDTALFARLGVKPSRPVSSRHDRSRRPFPPRAGQQLFRHRRLSECPDAQGDPPIGYRRSQQGQWFCPLHGSLLAEGWLECPLFVQEPNRLL